MSDKYILEGKIAVPTDLMTWATWFETGENRKVARTELENGKFVSTVFLGLDHQYGDGPPLIFESMVFASKDDLSDLDCERYSTWEEAEAGHKKMVEAYSD